MQCYSCSKKLKIVERQMACRCGNVFCNSHRFIVDHDCPYDHKRIQREKLIKENPVIIPDKINRI